MSQAHTFTCEHCQHVHLLSAIADGRTVLCSCGKRLKGERLIRSGAHKAPFEFIADKHLGKLACYLRLLGFDALWSRFADEEELVKLAFEQDRILLTRDSDLKARWNATDILLITEDTPRGQLQQLRAMYPMRLTYTLEFARCSRCNLELIPQTGGPDVTKANMANLVTTHWQCPLCQKRYSENAHIKRLYQLFDK